MENYHLILAVLWIAYAFFHSFFAAEAVKQRMMKAMGRSYKYYRFYYAVFAFVTLIAVVMYHAGINNSPLFWNAAAWQKVVAVVAGVAGAIIMSVCARVYFSEMTGLDAFSNKTHTIGLVKTGLHKYMRHPLYAGTLLVIWALFLWKPSLKNLISCGINTLYVVIGGWLEEKKLVARFGNSYRSYAAKTPLFFFKIK
ncbi:methyltransferase family protein [Foetidibacter luteolus]|uniref:methyltransferase family protein n=1 Tax=Foetidibacter luteolus TaxID=2608880 RepID=UPI00129AC754|nr:NnrU family protein [Foetidibacter luteolus]